MKINLLLNPANRSWIIQKIAERLAEELRPLGAEVSITDVPDPQADLVHHMSWAFANVKTQQPSTMFITHLDDLYKLNQIQSMLTGLVRVGICMSSDTLRQLQAHGCDPDSLYFISPAHDGLIEPRRIVIGITSRVYPDGRKREALLREVAGRMDLSAFTFRIFGLGWQPIIESLRQAGANVEYFGESDDFRKDYEVLQAAIPHFDYYLYLGMDEGSLGTLDALGAGIPTIITPQGFHLDLPHGMTHPVVSGNDLLKVLTDLAQQRQLRINAVAGLTWTHYAQRHLALWRAIKQGQPLPPLTEAPEMHGIDLAALAEQRHRQVMANARSPRRMLSAISRLPGLRTLRRWVDRARKVA